MYTYTSQVGSSDYDTSGVIQTPDLSSYNERSGINSSSTGNNYVYNNTMNENGSYYYIALKPWDPSFVSYLGVNGHTFGHEKQLQEGDLCFVYNNPQTNNYVHQVSVADIAKLNEVLQSGYYESKKLLDVIKPHNIQSNVNGIDIRKGLNNIFAYFGENTDDISKLSIRKTFDKIANLINKDPDFIDAGLIFNYPNQQNVYNRFVSLNPHKNKYNEINNDQEELFMKEILLNYKKEFDKNSTHLFDDIPVDRKNNLHNVLAYIDQVLTEMLAYDEKYVKYCTLHGVLSSWNFYGILHNTSEGKVGANLKMNSITGDMNYLGSNNIVNFTISGKAKVINRWGSELLNGTKLWVILKKITHDSAYQFIPWYNNYRTTSSNSPLINDLSYNDEMNGPKCVGVPFYIGQVIKYYSDNFTQEGRDISNCISRTNDFVFFERSLSEKIKISNSGKIDIML